jgi:hypothetical protein
MIINSSCCLYRAQGSSYKKLMVQLLIMLFFGIVVSIFFAKDIGFRKALPLIYFFLSSLFVVFIFSIIRRILYRLKICVCKSEILKVEERSFFTRAREFPLPIVAEVVTSTNGGFFTQIRINNKFYFGRYLDKNTLEEINLFLNSH